MLTIFCTHPPSLKIPHWDIPKSPNAAHEDVVIITPYTYESIINGTVKMPNASKVSISYMTTNMQWKWLLKSLEAQRDKNFPMVEHIHIENSIMFFNTILELKKLSMSNFQIHLSSTCKWDTEEVKSLYNNKLSEDYFKKGPRSLLYLIDKEKHSNYYYDVKKQLDNADGCMSANNQEQDKIRRIAKAVSELPAFNVNTFLSSEYLKERAEKYLQNRNQALRLNYIYAYLKDLFKKHIKKETLDPFISGCEDVKKYMINEVVSIFSYGERQSSHLFVGMPGTGKTHMATTIAKSLAAFDCMSDLVDQIDMTGLFQLAPMLFKRMDDQLITDIVASGALDIYNNIFETNHSIITQEIFAEILFIYMHLVVLKESISFALKHGDSYLAKVDMTSINKNEAIQGNSRVFIGSQPGPIPRAISKFANRHTEEHPWIKSRRDIDEAICTGFSIPAKSTFTHYKKNYHQSLDKRRSSSVVTLDEVDKFKDGHGTDRSGEVIPVLDPNISDKYMNVSFPGSPNVMILTGNDKYSISSPVKNRCFYTQFPLPSYLSQCQVAAKEIESAAIKMKINESVDIDRDISDIIVNAHSEEVGFRKIKNSVRYFMDNYYENSNIEKKIFNMMMDPQGQNAQCSIKITKEDLLKYGDSKVIDYLSKAKEDKGFFPMGSCKLVVIDHNDELVVVKAHIGEYPIQMGNQAHSFSVNFLDNTKSRLQNHSIREDAIKLTNSIVGSNGFNALERKFRFFANMMLIDNAVVSSKCVGVVVLAYLLLVISKLLNKPITRKTIIVASITPDGNLVFPPVDLMSYLHVKMMASDSLAETIILPPMSEDRLNDMEKELKEYYGRDISLKSVMTAKDAITEVMGNFDDSDF